MLKDRAEQARQVVRLCLIRSLDKKGRVDKVEVPGSEGHLYMVTIRRKAGKAVTTCNRVDRRGYVIEPCKGSYKTTCVHAIAALDKAAENSRKQIKWCESADDAKRLANLSKGKSFESFSNTSEKPLYFVVSE